MVRNERRRDPAILQNLAYNTTSIRLSFFRQCRSTMMQSEPSDLVLRAASFAARAHRHEVRKDGKTPYVAHVFRVCLVVRHVFGIDDPRVLCAALLHDTVEDTPTDYDDVADEFGPEIADWVAALTKDMRQRDDLREDAYCETLASAPWPVIVCKLGDIYDNMTDSIHLSPRAKMRSVGRWGRYLEALKTNLPPEAKEAYRITEQRFREVSTEELA